MSHQELLELYFSLGADDSLDDIMPKKHDDAAASTAPDTTTTLDKYVHVLAAADSHREHHDFPILGHNSSRLLLSEAVALFHLTQEHGDDAAAVCLFYSANDNIRFLVSKNRPCTPDEWASTRALVSAVQNAISKDELTEQLYKIFHKNCRKRISCHFCHLCEALTPRPKIGVTSEMAHALDRATASPTPHTTETAASVISSMVTSLKWASLERPRHFRELSLLCAVLAVVLDASPIQNLPLLAALSRVAAYKAAVGIISYWGFTNSFVNRRSKLSVEEVAPCSLPPAMLAQTGAEIMGMWARGHNQQPLDGSVFGQVMHRVPGCIPRCCHAEVALTLRALSMVTADRAVVEVGTSKRTCKLCSIFIEAVVNATPLHVVIGGPHGRVCPGWSLPANVPPAVEARFSVSLSRLVGTLYHQLGSSLESPLPPSGRETDSEGDRSAQADTEPAAAIAESRLSPDQGQDISNHPGGMPKSC